jgi:hypothetical protein
MANEEIISQIANSPEVLDPSWVLNLITVAAAFLLWSQIKDIKNILKGVNDLVQLHERDIAVMKHQINTLEKNK